MVVFNAVKSINRSACLAAETPAPKMQSASGNSGVNAVRTVAILMRSAASGPGNGSKSKLPRTVVKSAFLIHRPMNPLKRFVKSHGARFLAKVIGLNMTPAPPRLQFQVVSSVVEVRKRGNMWSPRQHSLVVRSAATHMERRTPRTVVTVHVRFLALATGMSGAIAVPLAVVVPCLDLTKSHRLPSMVVQTAPTMTATLRFRSVMSSHAPLTVLDLGAPGPIAPRNARIVRAMVQWVPQTASTPSRSKLSMVANSAPRPMARWRRSLAMTNAAQSTVLDHGANLVHALPLVEMASRDAPITSRSQLCMVVWNVPVAMNQLTPLLATLGRAPSTVRASGRHGPTVPRSAMVARRRLGF